MASDPQVDATADPTSPAPADPPAASVSLTDVHTRFVACDPKNKNVIGFEHFNTISSELSLMGDGVGADIHFADSVITFAEVCKVAGVTVPDLPISLNAVSDAFRKTAGSESGKVDLVAFAKSVSYLADITINPEDVQVNLEEACQKISSPDKKEYKLNVWKDAFRRWGKDGDGTLSNSEFAAVMRYYELDITCLLDVITMTDLIPLVVSDPSHPIFTLGVNMNEVRKAFDWCDADHNCVLDSGELAKALRLAGQNPSQADFKKLKQEFDQDCDGVFDFHEFTAVVCRSFMSQDEMRRKALEAFDVFDTDKSGTISLAELRRIMTTYGEDMSDEEVEELFAELDADADGKLDISEFVELLLN